jgi:hypothetical protein
MQRGCGARDGARVLHRVIAGEGSQNDTLATIIEPFTTTMHRLDTVDIRQISGAMK